MNSEVIRLRKLRRVILKLRALAEVLRGSEARDSLFARTGLLCWRIARIASGQLRAHPYQRYQRGPSFSHTCGDGVASIIAGILASKRGKRCATLLIQLESAARELDDVRSLTLTPNLSDALGRAQWDMRTLIGELAARAYAENGLVKQRAEPAQPATSVQSPSSPYLAL